MFETGINLIMTENVSAKLGVILPLLERANGLFLRLDQVAGKAAPGLSATGKALGLISRNLSKVNTAGAGGVPTTISNLSQMANKSALAAEKITFMSKAVGALNMGLHVFSRLGLAMWGLSMLKEGAMTIANPAIEMAQMRQQMAMTGLWSQSQIGQAELLSKQMVSSVPGTDAAANMEAIKETSSVFADPGRALKMAPVFAKAQQIMAAMSAQPGMEGMKGHEKNFAMSIARMAEQSGAISDPKKLEELLTGVVATSVRTLGTVGPQALLQQFTREGAAKYMLDIGSNLFMLGHKTQEMAGGGSGGARGMAGTQTAQFFNMAIGGTASKQTLANLAAIGLMPAPQGVKNWPPKPGEPWSGMPVKMGMIRDKQLLEDNMLAWATKQRKEIFDVKFPGFEGMPAQKQGDILFSTFAGMQKNAKQFLIELLMTPTALNMARQVGAQGKQPGVDQLSGMAGSAPAQRMDEIIGKWKRLMLTIGENPALLSLVSAGWDTLNSFLDTAWMRMEDINKSMEGFGKNKDVSTIMKSVGHSMSLLTPVAQGLATALSGLFSVISVITKDYLHLMALASPVFGAIAQAYISANPPLAAVVAAGQLAQGKQKSVPTTLGTDSSGFNWMTGTQGGQPIKPIGMRHPLLDIPFDWSKLQMPSKQDLPAPAMAPGGCMSQGKNLSSLPQSIFNFTINNHPLSGVDANQQARKIAEMVKPHIDKIAMLQTRGFTDSTLSAGGNMTSPNFAFGDGRYS
jgi:hypothetical protein